MKFYLEITTLVCCLVGSHLLGLGVGVLTLGSLVVSTEGRIKMKTVKVVLCMLVVMLVVNPLISIVNIPYSWLIGLERENVKSWTVSDSAGNCSCSSCSMLSDPSA